VVVSRTLILLASTMAQGRVASVNYLGPTGGLLSPNEQCAVGMMCRVYSV
jgi:hypothetical protein